MGDPQSDDRRAFDRERWTRFEKRLDELAVLLDDTEVRLRARLERIERKIDIDAAIEADRGKRWSGVRQSTAWILAVLAIGTAIAGWFGYGP